MDNQQEHKVKQIRKKGTLVDVPMIPSLFDMLCRNFNAVLVTCKLVEKKKPVKIHDGKVNCRCKKCGKRMFKAEMVQVNPKNPQYLLTPECAAKRLAKKQRLAERKDGTPNNNP